MRTRNTALVGALCVGLSAVLTACGSSTPEDPDAGTNGVGKLEPAAIQDKARAAARGAEAVHLSGNVVSQGRTYRIDMRLKKNGGLGRVSSSSDASAFELLRVGDELYLKAPAGFWAKAAASSPSPAPKSTASKAGDAAAAAGKLDDKYVKVPSDDPSYQQFKGFTDKDVLLDGLIGLQGRLTRGDRGTVGGVKTVRVNGANGGGGTLDVSLVGTPYPLRVQRAGGAGQLELDSWGKDFALAVPDKKQTVDYGKQLRIPSGS
ncbi:hypothetical protein [Streptomyces sp. NPDC053048]|uniref:hypothetical protein n=1 Tax=Streptomyces sp. NPDC053048 TaxID=3365694 RepID=UPI0037D4C02D